MTTAPAPEPATPPLVGPDELAALLTGPRPPRVLDVTFHLSAPGTGEQASARAAADHARAHLPGAVRVDVEQVFSGEVRDDRRGGRHPLPDADRLQAGLRAAGVREGEAVVVHDQGPGMGAARAWWVLRDAGLEDVRVLDGGLRAWRAAGLPTTDVPTEVVPGDVVVRPGRLARVAADEVATLDGSGRRVVDVRAPQRFRGEVEPLDPVAGHIPGATNLPATTLQHEDGRLLTPEQLRERLAGLQPGDVVSCGSGITASLALLAAEHAGVRGLVLYPGSWSDWTSDPSRPVQTGPGASAAR